MKKNNLVFLIIYIIIGGITINAETNFDNPLKLETAWELMEKNNPTLRSLLIDQKATLRDINSKDYLIPSISLTSSLSRSSELISSITNPQTTSEADNWSLSGGLSLKLNLNTALNLENQIKEIEYKILLLDKEIKIRDLRSELITLYYQISAGENTIQLQNRILGLSQSRFEQVEELYSRGLRSSYEVLSAKISVARDQPTLRKAVIDQEKRLITFKELLGVDPTQEINLEYLTNNENNVIFNEELTLFNPIENIEYQINILKLKLAQKTRELFLKDQNSPTIGFSLGWSTSVNPLFDSESWSSDEWEDSIDFGVSFALPLDPKIQGSKGQMDLLRLDDTITKATIILEESKRNIFDNINKLLLDLELSNSNIIMNELNVELQEENFKKLQSNFENGITSLQDLDTSRQSLQEALSSLESEKLNKNLLLTELDNIIPLTKYND